jgi:hypothetical protein
LVVARCWVGEKAGQRLMPDLFIGTAYNAGTVKAEGAANEDHFNISGSIDEFD